MADTPSLPHQYFARRSSWPSFRGPVDCYGYLLRCGWRICSSSGRNGMRISNVTDKFESSGQRPLIFTSFNSKKYWRTILWFRCVANLSKTINWVISKVLIFYWLAFSNATGHAVGLEIKLFPCSSGHNRAALLSILHCTANWSFVSCFNLNIYVQLTHLSIQEINKSHIRSEKRHFELQCNYENFEAECQWWYCSCLFVSNRV